MDQASKPESATTPFAVFANQIGATAMRPRAPRRVGAGARAPHVLRSLENLVAQGNTALGSGNMALAELRARQVLQQFPEYMPALLLLRKCVATAAPGSEEHEDVLRRILQLDPNDLMAATELCTLLFKRGETEECEVLARSCLRLMPLNPTLQSVMGLLLSQRGRPAAGEFHFRRVIELDGEKPVVANNLAFCLKLQGRVEESEQWYR
jgi:tetratricopeptide (TPR) repeat protein